MKLRIPVAVVAILLLGASPPNAQTDDGSASSIRTYFDVCDINKNGRISLREGRLALGIRRGEFRGYDTNENGVLSPEEFEQRWERMLDLLGASPKSRGGASGSHSDTSSSNTPPAKLRLIHAIELPVIDFGGAFDALSNSETGPEPSGRADNVPLRPRNLLFAFDTDASQGLSRKEVAATLSQSGMDLSADVIVGRTDRDESGELEVHELGPLLYLVAADLPKELPDPPAPKKPAPLPSKEPVVATGPDFTFKPEDSPSVDESDPAPDDENPNASNARSPGHFWRLDKDHDGLIGESDLRALLAPARASMRLATVVAALDTDGDGKLNPAELKKALGDR